MDMTPPERVPVHTALKNFSNQESVPATAPWPTARTPRPSLKPHEPVNTPTKQARNEDCSMAMDMVNTSVP